MRIPGLQQRSIFADMNTLDLNGPQDPFLLCKNIVRDPSATNPKASILSADPAEYIVAITSFTVEQSQKNKAKSFIRAKLKVLWSDCPELPAGRDATYLLNFDSQYFKEDYARLLCGFANKHVKELTEAMCEGALAPAQPLTAMRFCARARTYWKRTGNNVDFTGVTWSPILTQWDAQGNAVGFQEVENRMLLTL